MKLGRGVCYPSMKELGIDLVNATNPENGTLTYT